MPTVVKSNGKAAGLGLTVTSVKHPYIAGGSAGGAPLVQLVAKQLKGIDAGFTLTALQVIDGCRSQLHVDNQNMGLSMCLALGDFGGGEL